MNATSTKQKLVIVLKGVPNSGKTTTLNHLIQRLLGTKDSSLLEEDTDDPDETDRRVLIPYQGKRVYVATPGDLKAEVWKSIALSEIEECDILVTATRTTKVTLKPIEEYAEALHVAPVWVEKSMVDKDRDEADRAKAQYIKAIDKANRAQARELKDRIDAFIKEHP